MSEYISLLRDQDGSTILHLLVSKQEQEKLAFAMTQDALKAICNVKENVTGKTCYHLASESDNEDIMKALLEVEDIYSLDVYTGYETAEDYKKVLLLECGRRYILKAIKEKKLAEVVQLVSILFDDSVLESLIVPLSEARGENGKTVMHVAIESENLKALGLLLSLPNTELRDVKDSTNKSCYDLLVSSLNTDIIKLILGVESIEDIELYRGYRESPTKQVLLLECGRRYILKAIKEKKLAEVVQLVSILFDDSVLESLMVPLSEARGENGKTVMHVAIEEENLKSIDLLLSLPNTELRDVKDSTDKSRYDLLVSSHNNDIIKLILGVESIEDIELYRGYRESPTEQVLLEELALRYLFKLVIEGKQDDSIVLIDVLPIASLASRESTEKLKLIHLVALHGRLAILKHMLTKDDDTFREQIVSESFQYEALKVITKALIIPHFEQAVQLVAAQEGNNRGIYLGILKDVLEGIRDTDVERFVQLLHGIETAAAATTIPEAFQEVFARITLPEGIEISPPLEAPQEGVAGHEQTAEGETGVCQKDCVSCKKERNLICFPELSYKTQNEESI